MDIHEHEMPWIKRIEKLIEVLDGSTIGELELHEAGTEIIIRRNPDMVLVSSPTLQAGSPQPLVLGGTKPTTLREDRTQPVATPMTGVYYSAPSPSSPPFVNIGEVIYVGQVIALIEAMKVFNEIQAEVAGRVVGFAAKNGEVVQKGEALIKIEPL